MIIEVSQDFTLPYPSTLEHAVLYLTDVQKSLAQVRFIRDLQISGKQIYANLIVDVPVLGEQKLDFHSILEPHRTGANLLAQERTGRAWAAVAGQGSAVQNANGTQILYALQIAVHLELLVGDKWGGKAFEKMARATAQTAIQRLTLEFGRGVLAGMP